jgi:hypothetical protein
VGFSRRGCFKPGRCQLQAAAHAPLRAASPSECRSLPTACSLLQPHDILCKLAYMADECAVLLWPARQKCSALPSRLSPGGLHTTRGIIAKVTRILIDVFHMVARLPVHPPKAVLKRIQPLNREFIFHSDYQYPHKASIRHYPARSHLRRFEASALNGP